ncbi:MAG: hypothetical protein AMXMBFR53_07050 [Gemmatimonadota bacterium]
MLSVGVLWCAFNSALVRTLAAVTVGGGVVVGSRLLARLPKQRAPHLKHARAPVSSFNRKRTVVIALAMAGIFGAVGGVVLYFSLYARMGGVTSCPLPEGAAPKKWMVYGLYVLGGMILVAMGIGGLLSSSLKANGATSGE